MGMNVGRRGSKGVKDDINITPLIDVVLVLLIIFMVLVPSSLKQLTATVPQKVEPSDPQPPSTQLVVKIAADGALALDAEPVAAAAFPERVRDRLARDSQKLVFFDVADKAPYGEAIRVMDIVKGIGARRLAIVTRD